MSIETVVVNANNDIWTQAASGHSDVLIQRNTFSSVIVVSVVNSSPSSASSNGIQIRGDNDTFAVSSLSGTDKVYVKSLHGNTNVTVVRKS